MRGRFFKGLATGAILGAAAGMMIMPGMDRMSKKRVVRAGKRISGFADGMWDRITNFRR